MPLNLTTGWTLIAFMACLATFANWSYRPRNSITGGGGITDIQTLQDVYELLPYPIIASLKWTGSVLYTIGRWVLAVATGYGRSSPDNYELVIAVVSRLANIERRNMIRKTWKTLTSENTGSDPIASKVYFVMPEWLCPLDPHWRLHDSGCEPWQMVVPPNANENTYVNPTRIAKSMVKPGLAYDGIGFRVKFPVMVRNLGIAKRGLTPYAIKGTNLTVQLVDALRPNDVLVSVNFTKTDLDEDHSDDGYLYKSLIQEMSLPRGFEGYLRIKTIPLESKTSSLLPSDTSSRNGTTFSGNYISLSLYVMQMGLRNIAL